MTDAPMTYVAPKRRDWILLAMLSAIPLLAELAGLLSKDYGYFIDEFYFIACAKRLAFGYVDHPPLAPWGLAATRLVLGDALWAIRLPAYLATSATVWVTGLVVWRLGGARFATVLAGLTVGLSPVLLAMGSFYSMNAFEPLLWTLIVLTLVQIIQTGRARLWLFVGALIGLAFQNKHTVIVYLAALAVGVLATRTRRVLLDRWLWAGAAVAVVLAVPNVVWQVANGWPSIEFYRNAHLLKNVPATALASMAAQVLAMNPVAGPVWMAGLVYLLVHRDARELRFLGVAFLVLLALHVASQTSRPDRTSAAYPPLLAAGAVVIEGALRRLGERRPILARSVAVAVPAMVVLSALAVAPGVLPILPPPVTAKLAGALGLTAPAERGKSSPIPQLLADRTGWESYVDDVERVYRSLPAADLAQVVFYAPSYGQAGSLELFGPARGLPDRVIGAQNTYWHWSVGRTNTDVLIAVDANPETLRQLFAEVWEAGRIRCDYCMSWRNDIPIFVARRSIAPIDSLWPRFRHYE